MIVNCMRDRGLAVAPHMCGGHYLRAMLLIDWRGDPADIRAAREFFAAGHRAGPPVEGLLKGLHAAAAAAAVPVPAIRRFPVSCVHTSATAGTTAGRAMHLPRPPLQAASSSSSSRSRAGPPAPLRKAAAADMKQHMIVGPNSASFSICDTLPKAQTLVFVVLLTAGV